LCFVALAVAILWLERFSSGIAIRNRVHGAARAVRRLLKLASPCLFAASRREHNLLAVLVFVWQLAERSVQRDQRAVVLSERDACCCRVDGALNSLAHRMSLLDAAPLEGLGSTTQRQDFPSIYWPLKPEGAVLTSSSPPSSPTPSVPHCRLRRTASGARYAEACDWRVVLWGAGGRNGLKFA